MPAGIPVGTLAIGKAGATNAALLAVAILAARRPDLRQKLRAFRQGADGEVLKETLPEGSSSSGGRASSATSSRGGSSPPATP